MMSKADSGNVLPWQNAHWQQVMRQYAQDRMPHAILLTGPAGLGQTQFAHRLAQSWLCAARNAESSPCGHCRDCVLMQAGNHPDAMLLRPEEGKNEIGVQATRALIQRLQLTGNSGRRVAIIDPADQMNRASANAFLKTLEEPGRGVLLLLVASQLHRLPATVTSRCQRLVFGPPNTKDAVVWLTTRTDEKEDAAKGALQLAGGAPLKALDLLTEEARSRRAYLIGTLKELSQGKADPQLVAVEWCKKPLAELLETMARWLAMALRAQWHGESPLTALIARADAETIFALYREINEIRAALDTQLRTDLMITSLLIQWIQLTRPPAENRKK